MIIAVRQNVIQHRRVDSRRCGLGGAAPGQLPFNPCPLGSKHLVGRSSQSSSPVTTPAESSAEQPIRWVIWLAKNLVNSRAGYPVCGKTGTGFFEEVRWNPVLKDEIPRGKAMCFIPRATCIAKAAGSYAPGLPPGGTHAPQALPQLLLHTFYPFCEAYFEMFLITLKQVRACLPRD